MLIVLTDGELIWDEFSNDFNWTHTTALTANLRGKFKNEPHYVDLRWAKKESQLSLRHSQFHAAILDLAAPLHGQSKEELDGEDVRQYKKVRLWIITAVSLLGVLTLTSLLAAYFAIQENFAIQEKNGTISEDLAFKAKVGLTDDPEQSLLMAIQAINISQTPGAEDILRKTLFESRVRAKLQIPQYSHTNPIWMVKFSSDSGHVTATNVKDGAIQVLTMATLKNHTTQVHGKAFNNGDSVLYIDDDGKAELRSIKTDTQIELPVRLNNVEYAALSPDSKFMLISGNDNVTQIMDITVGTVKELKENKDRIQKAIFSPDNQFLVTMDSSWKAQLWDVRKGSLVSDLPGHTSKLGTAANVSVVQFSPNGNYIATSCGFGIEYPADCHLYEPQEGLNSDNIDKFDGVVRIWKKNGDRFELFRELNTGDDRVYGLAFDPKGQLMVTASGDKRARVWDVDTGKSILPIKEHSNWVWSAAFNPDSNLLVTTDSTGGAARIWNVDSDKEAIILRGHQNFVGNAVFSPDGRFVLTTGNDGTARVWEINIGQTGKYTELKVIDDTPDANVLAKIRQNSNSSWNKAVSSLDKKLIVTYNDQELSRVTPQVWQAETGTQIRLLESSDKDRYKDGILAASFSDDNQYLALAEYGNVVRVWHIGTGKENALIGHERFVHHIVFSPNAECVVTASNDEETVRVWRTTTGDPLETLPKRLGEIRIAFDSDGKHLLTHQDNELDRSYFSGGCAPIEEVKNIAKQNLEQSNLQY